MSAKRSLHRSQRAGSAKEVALKRILGRRGRLRWRPRTPQGSFTCSGGAVQRLWSLTLYPTPLTGVDNEEAMRFVIAACVFGIAAWGVVSLVEAILSRLGQVVVPKRVARGTVLRGRAARRG